MDNDDGRRGKMENFLYVIYTRFENYFLIKGLEKGIFSRKKNRLAKTPEQEELKD
jgi:hypothetical protein